MQATRDFLRQLGLPPGDLFDLPTSPKRFPDGAQYRVEIPSVEGPNALAAVLAEAAARKVRVHRVSQGSGIMLLTDAEIREMAKLGAEARVEVSLFVGPRAAWETGAQITAPAGKNLGARQRGMNQVVYAIEDIKRACSLGIRSVLVADEGLLWVGERDEEGRRIARRAGAESFGADGRCQPGPASACKSSLVQVPITPPPTWTCPMLAAIRAAVSLPLDIYVEVPDNFGGFVRHYEIPRNRARGGAGIRKVRATQRARRLPQRLTSGEHRHCPEQRARAAGRNRAGLATRYYPQATQSELAANGCAAGRRVINKHRAISLFSHLGGIKPVCADCCSHCPL